MAEYPSVLKALLAKGDRMSSYTPTLREKGVDWLARNWYGDNREGTHKAEKLSNVLETVTPYGMATMGYDAGRALGGGQPVQGALMLGMAGLPLPAAVEKKAAQGIRAYHGSPHSFDKFSLDKIGTGEGAQAYGHGLYFAENEGVAKGYRDSLAKSQGKTMAPLIDGMEAPKYSNNAAIRGADDEYEAAKQYWQFVKSQSPGSPLSYEALNTGEISNEKLFNEFLGWMKSQKEQAGPQYAEYYNSVMTGAEKIKGKLTPNPPAGSMYEVNINANPDDFLDWDKPLSEQPESVRKAYTKAKMSGDPILSELFDNTAADSTTLGLFDKSAGSQAYNTLAGKMDAAKQSEASQLLRQSGIPGIKYLDAGSRGAGDGSRNYVVFDDKLIQIVKKYGIAGASAMLGMDVLANMDDAQAAQLKKAENMGKIQNSLTSGGW